MTDDPSKPREPAPCIHCAGIAFPPFNRCLAHLTATEFDEALGRLGSGADVYVTGMNLNEKLVERLKAAVEDADGTPVFGDVKFSDVVFDTPVSFSGVIFDGRASFDGAHFRDSVDFSHATFRGATSFAGAEFFRVSLEDVVCDTGIEFDRARFYAACTLGPFSAGGTVNLQHAVFERKVTVKAEASRVSADQASFTEAFLGFDHAGISLDYVKVSESLTVAPATGWRDGWPTRSAMGETPAIGRSGPRLLSLPGVDSSRLRLIDVDLSECRFADAVNLDALRFEGSRTRFAKPYWARPARRQMLADELDWRRTHPVLAPRSGDAPGTALEPERIQEIYRQLRKALEDAKNEPGAADFYYGEMEMRRYAATTPRAERLILRLYWMVSGYGLRLDRALRALAVTLALSTVAFATVGFAPSAVVRYQPLPARPGVAQAYQQVTVAGPRPGWLEAFLYSLHSSTSLLSDSTPIPLTAAGSVVQIIVKLLGPLFVGLALLAIRNRVKR